MNYEETPEDCQHLGFFILDLNPMVLICWQCQAAFSGISMDDW